jgi:TolB protein
MGYRIYEIYVMDADGSNLQNLGYGLSPVWSPNGNYIVFVCGHYPNWAVCKMNANGTHRHRVNLALDGTWSKDHTRSPDGRYITFSSCRDGNCEIYVMNADGTDQRNLTQHPAMDSNPAWSP